jgi:hypothetical protein
MKSWDEEFRIIGFCLSGRDYGTNKYSFKEKRPKIQKIGHLGNFFQKQVAVEILDF